MLGNAYLPPKIGGFGGPNTPKHEMSSPNPQKALPWLRPEHCGYNWYGSSVQCDLWPIRRKDLKKGKKQSRSGVWHTHSPISQTHQTWWAWSPPDVVTRYEFHRDRFTGLRSRGVRNRHFPIGFPYGLYKG
jgi:hypothetical protein